MKDETKQAEIQAQKFKKKSLNHCRMLTYVVLFYYCTCKQPSVEECAVTTLTLKTDKNDATLLPSQNYNVGYSAAAIYIKMQTFCML